MANETVYQARILSAVAMADKNFTVKYMDTTPDDKFFGTVELEGSFANIRVWSGSGNQRTLQAIHVIPQHRIKEIVYSI